MLGSTIDSEFLCCVSICQGLSMRIIFAARAHRAQVHKNLTRTQFLCQLHPLTDSAFAGCCMMSELEYRPQRNSAVMEDVAGPDAVVMGQVDVQGLPLESQPAAPVPASGERPVPKPRNLQFLQPVAPAQPPHVIQPVPLPAAQPPHFIQPDPLAAAQPPPYQYQQQAPLPPYQPGAGAQQHQQFVASQQALAANPAAADGTAEKTLPFAVFQMRVKGSKKFCTIWRGVLEITARAAIIVSQCCASSNCAKMIFFLFRCWAFSASLSRRSS